MGKKVLLVLCTLCVFSLPALGSGFPDTYAFSVRSLALGGAFTAVADDFSAAYYNPAGLAQFTGNRVNLEYLYTSPQIDVKTLDGEDLIIRLSNGEVKNNPTEYKGGSGLDLRIPIIGLAIDINDVVNLPLHCELGLAISMPEKNDVMYRIMAYPPDQPHFFRYGNDIDRIHAALGLGFELVKDLVYFGVGGQVMLYGDGKIYIDGLSVGVDDENKNVVAQVKQSSLLQLDPSAGIMITPFEKKLKIGFSYRDKEEVEIDPMPAVISVDGLPEANLGMTMGLNAFFTPREFSLGASYDFGPVMLSGEANLQKWSDYKFSPADSAADSTGQYFFPGDPDFDDTVNYRLGVEIKLNDKGSVMLGYSHLPTPIPDQSGRVTNYIDTDKDMFSLGGKYSFMVPSLNKPMTIEGAFQYQRLKSYTVYKDGITGDNGGFTWRDQVSYEVSGDAYAGGVSIGLAW